MELSQAVAHPGYRYPPLVLVLSELGAVRAVRTGRSKSFRIIAAVVPAVSSDAVEHVWSQSVGHLSTGSERIHSISDNYTH